MRYSIDPQDKGQDYVGKSMLLKVTKECINLISAWEFHYYPCSCHGNDLK